MNIFNKAGLCTKGLPAFKNSLSANFLVAGSKKTMVKIQKIIG